MRKLRLRGQEVSGQDQECGRVELAEATKKPKTDIIETLYSTNSGQLLALGMT
jgi:hypothetical protein